MTGIGNYAFTGCTGLTSITIPNSVTSIGEWAFNGCSGLTSIDSKIANVFIINDNTFSNETYNNAELHILGGLKSKYQQVSGWKQFKNITEDKNVFACGPRLTCTYSDSDAKLTIQGDGAMWDNSSSTSVPWNSYKTNISTIIIEDGATTIGENAFNGCTDLYSVTFGKGITSVGTDAFKNCSNVKKVIASDVAAWCGIYFANATANPLYYTKKLYQDKTTEITALTIPDKVTHIGYYAFYGCTGLTSVTIGNGVTSIGNGAFYGCSSLTSVTIPNSVTTIGGSAFYGCSGLTSITIGNSVTGIGNYAFAGCTGLTSVEFHCKEIGLWFSGLTSIKEVTIGEEVTSIGGKAFYGCSGLEKIVIPSIDKWCSVNIGAEALPQKFHIYSDEETEITSVDIPEGVTSVNAEVFNGCAWITSVSIPNTVKNIGSYAFQNCSALTSITIPNSVTTIGSSAFSGCI